MEPVSAGGSTPLWARQTELQTQAAAKTAQVLDRTDAAPSALEAVRRTIESAQNDLADGVRRTTLDLLA